MQTAMALLFNAAEYLGEPIDGPPTNVESYIYSGTKIGFSWTNGDVDASIQYSYDNGSTVEGELAPKTHQHDTGMAESVWNASGNTFAVRHIDGIYTTAWVSGD